MKTKICKYCKEPIAAEATKCPKCQSFQSRYLNPKYLSLLYLLFIPFLLYPLFNLGPEEKVNYLDYKEEITMSVIRKDTLEHEDCRNCDLLNIIVELDNKTDIEWEQGEYQVEFKTAAGELLNIEKRGDFQLRLHPNSKSQSAIKVPIYQEYSNTAVTVKLVNLRHNRY